MNNPLDYFDAIYCVNLDERTDRWDHALAQFEKLGISDRVERFSAIKPTHDNRWDRDVPWKVRGRYPKIGAVGCAESHKAIIQLAKDGELKNVLVLEDDFMVCDNWRENLECALVDLDEFDWDLFYLGYHLRKAEGMVKNLGQCLRQIQSKRKRGIFFTIGLAYSFRTYDYLLAKIDSFNWQRFGRQGHVDKWYTRCRTIKKYFAEPSIVEPNWSLGSDIKR